MTTVGTGDFVAPPPRARVSTSRNSSSFCATRRISLFGASPTKTKCSVRSRVHFAVAVAGTQATRRAAAMNRVARNMATLTSPHPYPSIDDVGDVQYIASTALGAMLRAHATVTRLGGALKLLHVRGHVREQLEITRLLPVFEAFDSAAEAIAD